MKVLFLVRTQEPWPGKYLLEGIMASGDQIVSREEEADLLLSWNLYGHAAQVQARMKAAGKRTFVAENGYLRRDMGSVLIEEDGHNGLNGSVVVPKTSNPDRLTKVWGIPSMWRFYAAEERLNHNVIVAGQLGGGYNRLAMPDTWPIEVCKELRDLGRHVVFFPHRLRRNRGFVNSSLATTLNWEVAEDTLNIFKPRAVVSYTGSAVTTALLNGYPGVYAGPHHIMAGSALRYQDWLNGKKVEPSYEFFARFWEIAWRQWTREELVTGRPWLYATGRVSRKEAWK